MDNGGRSRVRAICFFRAPNDSLKAYHESPHFEIDAGVEKLGADRKGYLINVASAKNGVGYGTWLHIDGWSDKELDYIVRYEANGAE